MDDKQFKYKAVKSKISVLKKRSFKICTWSYKPIKEYITIIQQKSELYI